MVLLLLSLFCVIFSVAVVYVFVAVVVAAHGIAVNGVVGAGC